MAGNLKTACCYGSAKPAGILWFLILAASLLAISKPGIGAECKSWNLATDFASSKLVLTQPVIEDSCGQAVWFLDYADPGATNPSGFHPFDFQNDPAIGGDCTPGGRFLTWSEARSTPLPYISLNATGDTQSCLGVDQPWPAGSVLTHPSWDGSSGVVLWQSPIAGLVNFQATLTDFNGECGDGVNWFVGKNSNVVSTGVLNNGSGNSVTITQTFLAKKNDRIYLGIGPNNFYACDTTRIDVVIWKGAPEENPGLHCGPR